MEATPRELRFSFQVVTGDVGDSREESMGIFRHTIAIFSADGAKAEEVEALVDTGSSFAWIPTDTLDRLGIAGSFREEFETIDGRVIERQMAVVVVRLDGQTLPTLVVFGDEGTEPVIGAYTLEGFRLAPDPVNRRLVRVRGLLMRRVSFGCAPWL